MARTSDSVKRMVWPRSEVIKMSESPLVGNTDTSSSPSRRLRAMSPARSDES